MRAGAPGPGVLVIADNRGVKVLVDKGVILCGCVLLALLAGEVDAVAVIWLLLAVAPSGSCGSPAPGGSSPASTPSGTCSSPSACAKTSGTG